MKLKNDLKRKVSGWLTMLMLFSCYGEAYAQADSVVYAQEETEVCGDTDETVIDEAADEMLVTEAETAADEAEVTDVSETAAAEAVINAAGGYDIDWQAYQSGYISNRFEAEWLKADGTRPRYPDDELVQVYAVEVEDEDGEGGI